MFSQLIGFCLLYYGIYYFINLRKAKRMRLPYISVPFVSQNSLFWIIAGPASHKWLKRRLPTWLYDRIVMTIYGFEFFTGQKPYRDWIEPQVKADPDLVGDGRTYALVTSGNFEINTYDAEVVQQVLVRPRDFRQNEMASFVVAQFGNNVLTTDGADWSRHRRIVAGAVTERVSSVVWNESLRQTQALLDLINTQSSGMTNKLFDFVKTITIHVLYAAGMGEQQSFESAIAAERLLKPGKTLTYIDAVKIVNENVAGPIVLPERILLNWPNWLPGHRWFHELGRAKREFPLYTTELLEDERARARASSETRNNIMSALVAASDRAGEDGDSRDKQKGPALSREELIGNLYIFTAAGFDTTANTIAYAMVLLTQNPEWQDWIFEEIDKEIPEDSKLEYTATFPKMVRILAVLFETLRLFPAILHITKQVQVPQEITTSKMTIRVPSKCTVYVNSVALHRDPATWRDLNLTPEDLVSERYQNRPDELRFRPSRWINPAGSSHTHFQPPKGTYVPWSGGPRVCPGQKMAQVEFTGILVTMLCKHRLEVVRRDGESDNDVWQRLDHIMAESAPKLTMEMDVFNVKVGEDRGVTFRFVKRR